jgi:hypothetical protein
VVMPPPVAEAAESPVTPVPSTGARRVRFTGGTAGGRSAVVLLVLLGTVLDGKISAIYKSIISIPNPSVYVTRK